MTEPKGELVYLGVRCDGPSCDQTLSADFKVGVDDDKATRLGYVLDYARSLEWRVVGRADPLTAKTFCPRHRPAAR